MQQVKPYLIFSGSCKEALEFYKECFDGEIVAMQTFADSPVDVPEDYKEKIFNSEFRADNIVFMASDDLPDKRVTIGSNFALLITISGTAEQEKVFDRLSEGGRVLFPIENNFGMLVDKYGIQWMLESRK